MRTTDHMDRVRPYAICPSCFEPYPAGSPCAGCFGGRQQRLHMAPSADAPPAPRRGGRFVALYAIGFTVAAALAIAVGYLAAI